MTPERYKLLKNFSDGGMISHALQMNLTTIQEVEEFKRTAYPDAYKTTLDKAIDSYLTVCPRMLKMKENARKFSLLDINVLIQGESGTGKELVARILHGNRQGPFVAVNCAAISENLFESELFGHTKGSFSGATSDRLGYIDHAHNGTLFLDEIGDMPQALQAKLLRTLQNKTFRRVGDNEEKQTKCRFVFATHQKLDSLVKDKRFRQDLYYRINTLVLNISPLTDRPEDISLFLDNQKIEDFELRTKITQHFKGAFGTTGNYRELESMILRYKHTGEII